MDAQIAVNFENEVTREDVEQAIEEVSNQYPGAEIRIVEPKGVFPLDAVGVFTLVIAINSTTRLALDLYPLLKERLSKVGGEVRIADSAEFAKELLVNHTGLDDEEVNICDKTIDDGYHRYDVRSDDQDKRYRIQVDPKKPEDWELEEL